MKYKTVEINFPEALIPENVEELIRRLEDTDNRTVAQKARKEEDNGDFSPGLIKAVKEAIQLYNRRNSSNNSAGRTAKDARIDFRMAKIDEFLKTGEARFYSAQALAEFMEEVLPEISPGESVKIERLNKGFVVTLND